MIDIFKGYDHMDIAISICAGDHAGESCEDIFYRKEKETKNGETSYWAFSPRISTAELEQYVRRYGENKGKKLVFMTEEINRSKKKDTIGKIKTAMTGIDIYGHEYSLKEKEVFYLGKRGYVFCVKRYYKGEAAEKIFYEYEVEKEVVGGLDILVYNPENSMDKGKRKKVLYIAELTYPYILRLDYYKF